MNPERSKQYTPEETAKLQKDRIISDASLLHEGAEYVPEEDGSLRLSPTRSQMESIRAEFKNEQQNKALLEEFAKSIKEKLPMNKKFKIHFAGHAPLHDIYAVVTEETPGNFIVDIKAKSAFSKSLEKQYKLSGIDTQFDSLRLKLKGEQELFTTEISSKDKNALKPQYKDSGGLTL